jgi:Dodecin
MNEHVYKTEITGSSHAGPEEAIRLAIEKAAQTAAPRRSKSIARNAAEGCFRWDSRGVNSHPRSRRLAAHSFGSRARCHAAL